MEASCSSALINIEDLTSENSRINDHIAGSAKICPLCNSEVRLFFINFNEKLLMCENTECEYPYGYEELQFFKEEDDKCSQNEVMSIRTGLTMSYGGSTACWSDLGKLNNVVLNEDIGPLDKRALDVNEYMIASTSTLPRKTLEEQNIEKNIRELNQLTIKLANSTEKRSTIKNRSWLRNLTSLQRKSGVKLVKPLEMDKQLASELSTDAKVSVEIGPADSELSVIKIEIKSDCNV